MSITEARILARDDTVHDYKICVAAAENERNGIFRLRYEVYVEEMGREQKYAIHEQRLVAEPLDKNAVILGAFLGERAVGTCRINFSANSLFDNSDLYDFDRFERQYPGRVAFVTKMMVAPDFRGSCLFSDLSKAAFAVVKDHCGGVVVIDCNEHLVSAFERLGFRSYRGRLRHPNYGIVTPMYLEVADEAHLRAVSSPLLNFVSPLEQKEINL